MTVAVAVVAVEVAVAPMAEVVERETAGLVESGGRPRPRPLGSLLMVPIFVKVMGPACFSSWPLYTYRGNNTNTKYQYTRRGCERNRERERQREGEEKSSTRHGVEHLTRKRKKSTRYWVTFHESCGSGGKGKRTIAVLNTWLSPRTSHPPGKLSGPGAWALPAPRPCSVSSGPTRPPCGSPRRQTGPTSFHLPA